MSNTCASSSTAFRWRSLSGRPGDVALAVGAEKMVSDDRSKAFGLFRAADVPTCGSPPRCGSSARNDDGVSPAAAPLHGCRRRFHIRRSGPRGDRRRRSEEPRHSVHNPRAQCRKPFTVQEISPGARGGPRCRCARLLPRCRRGGVLCSEAALRRLAAAFGPGSRPVPQRHRTAAEALDRRQPPRGMRAYAAGVARRRRPRSTMRLPWRDHQVENLGFCCWRGRAGGARRYLSRQRLPVNPPEASGGAPARRHGADDPARHAAAVRPAPAGARRTRGGRERRSARDRGATAW
jgi:hypothetical protein